MGVGHITPMGGGTGPAAKDPATARPMFALQCLKG